MGNALTGSEQDKEFRQDHARLCGMPGRSGAKGYVTATWNSACQGIGIYSMNDSTSLAERQRDMR